MNDYIEIFVPGKPATSGSKNFYGRGKVAPANKRQKPWQKTIATYAQIEVNCVDGRSSGSIGFALFYNCAVKMKCVFILPRPKSHFNKYGILRTLAPKNPVSKKSGDLDKMYRAVGDALNGIIYEDDSQICDFSDSKKIYADELNPTIGVRIYVSKL